jgi:hypothetical protein
VDRGPELDPVTPSVGAEFSGRSHRCFDYDQFLIGDAAVLVQYPRARIRPYVGGGVGYRSDPGFMGSHVGVLATVAEHGTGSAA